MRHARIVYQFPAFFYSRYRGLFVLFFARFDFFSDIKRLQHFIGHWKRKGSRVGERQWSAQNGFSCVFFTSKFISVEGETYCFQKMGWASFSMFKYRSLSCYRFRFWLPVSQVIFFVNSCILTKFLPSFSLLHSSPTTLGMQPKTASRRLARPFHRAAARPAAAARGHRARQGGGVYTVQFIVYISSVYSTAVIATVALALSCEAC